MTIIGLKSAPPAPYPAHFDIEKVVRPNILALHPYRCARDDYSTGILLDANENSLGHSIPHSSPDLPDPELDLDLHRYPDPSHDEIKSRIARLRGLPGPEYVFLGVGSDEVIDILMRVTCAPQKDAILTTPPTYGMYGVCAQVNDVQVVKVPLDVEKGRFQPRVDEIRKAVSANPNIKLIMLCSPGNPTGTLIPIPTITEILEIPDFRGIVVVDEAYVDFSPEGSSATSLIQKYSNLCVTQSLSKSFGLAAVRVGAALAQPPLIQILTNTKAPYNVSTPSALLALRAVSDEGIALMRSKVSTITNTRASLIASLAAEPFPSLGVAPVIGGNDANFVMMPVLAKDGSGKPDNERAKKLYKHLAEECGVVVRYRGSELGCEGCVRPTIGTEEENKVFLEKLEASLRLF